MLVARSDQGEAFELTRSARVVWRYVTPHTDAARARATIRVKRFASELLEPRAR